MSLSPLRIVVSSTAGGVGTTTLTALLFDLLSTRDGVPSLADHTSGNLGARLPRGDDADFIDSDLLLHDLGPHADGEGLDLLESPATLAVLVTANTPLGLLAVSGVLGAIRKRYGQAGLSRVTVVCTSTFGRPRTRSLVEAVHTTYGRGIILVIPHDRALSGPGRIATHRLHRRTVAAGDLVARRIRSLIGLYRR